MILCSIALVPTSVYCGLIAEQFLLLFSQLVCTPTSWRISMVGMLAVTLAVSFLVEVSVHHWMCWSALIAEQNGQVVLFLSPPQPSLRISSKTGIIAATSPLLPFLKALHLNGKGMQGLATFPFLWWVGSIRACPRLEKYGQSLVFSPQILKSLRRNWSQFSGGELWWS